MERVRVDKWVWAARFCKTRSAATELVAGGRVRVNGVAVKPSRELTIGDTVELTLGQQRWTVVVAGLAERRGPASVASTLYDETPESVAERERRAAERRLARPVGADREGGRPTKRDRRLLDSLRRAQRRGGRPG